MPKSKSEAEDRTRTECVDFPVINEFLTGRGFEAKNVAGIWSQLLLTDPEYTLEINALAAPYDPDKQDDLNNISCELGVKMIISKEAKVFCVHSLCAALNRVLGKSGEGFIPFLNGSNEMSLIGNWHLKGEKQVPTIQQAEEMAKILRAIAR